MKNELYQVLDFSKYFVGGLIDLHDCQHHGDFDKDDSRCIHCEQSH